MLKKVKIIFVVLLITSSIAAQLNIVWDAETTTGSSYESAVEKVVFDSEGNTIIAGFSNTTFSNSTIFVMKFSNSGEEIWFYKYPLLSEELNGSVKAMFLDNFDNVLVIVDFFGTLKTINLNKDGSLISIKDHFLAMPHNTDRNILNYADNVYRSSSGSIVLGGLMTFFGSEHYSYYAKLDILGNLIASDLSIVNTVENFGNSLISYFDKSSGELYYISSVLNYSNYHWGVCLTKMNGSGGFEWTKITWFDDIESSFYPVDLLRDNNGNFYLAIVIDGAYPSRLIKLAPDGTLIWDMAFEEKGIKDIEFDVGLNIWVAGYGFNNNKSYLAKISSAAEIEFEFYSSSNQTADKLIASDDLTTFGYMYCAERDISGEAMISKYNSFGEKQDSIRARPESYSQFNLFEQTPDKNFVLCQNNLYSIYVEMLSENPTGVESEKIPSDYFLSQNYPNPFNPSTTIKFAIPNNVHKESFGLLQHVTLKVYDILGKEISILVNDRLNAGNYEVQFDASNLTSGIYLYKLAVGSKIETRKMILMK